MKKSLLNGCITCLMLLIATLAKAQSGNVTATWDFSTDPLALSSGSFQGETRTLAANGVDLTIDATSGKVRDNGNSYQMTTGVKVRVPVTSTRDSLRIVGYPKYWAYNIGGTAATDESQFHKATYAEAQQGYVEIEATDNNNYIVSITVTQVSSVQEKNLYDTDFTEWEELTDYNSVYKDPSAAPATHAATAKYSHENFTFSTWGVGSYPTTDSKNIGTTGYLMAGKYSGEIGAEPYIETTELASVTKVEFVQYATGSNRGWKLYAKGNGDADWVLVSSTPVSASRVFTPTTVAINRTNVKLRFENLALPQNAYMSELHIYGMVDMSKSPSLASFTANGVTYQAADVFDEDADGNYTTTVEVSKSGEMVNETANPVTAVSDNGELGTIIYESVESSDNGGKPAAKVTIPVTLTNAAGTSVTANYIVNFVWKPNYTVNYFNVDGEKIAEQSVEKDAAIGTLNDGSAVTIAEGSKFRGWLFKATGDEKASAATVVSSPTLNLYALVTDIEGDEADERNTYNLKNRYFYVEDHEAFVPTSAYSFNGTQHGLDIKPGSVKLLVGGNATIIVEACKYSKAPMILTDASGNTVGEVAVPTSDGEKTVLKYTGAAGELTLSFTDEIYLHSLTIINTGEGDIVKNEEGYYVAEAGNGSSFLNILDIIAANEDGNSRVKIFLPDGTYDLGRMVEKELPFNNISIVGQSMDKTILVTTPDVSIEGLGSADMFYNTKQNIYFQDLTLKNALDYYAAGSAGRAAVIQDRGNRTIYKNVRMLSYQDTYYSQNSAMQSYFDSCDVHGTVDFLCGGGDVRFQNTTISLEPRNLSGSGGRTITAPTTTTPFGYVFDNCKIVDLANGKGDWNYGRTWQNEPIAVFLNTTLDDNAANTIVASRWTQKGMNNKDPKVFGEYGTVNTNGENITPASNIITSYGGTFETILTADQAAAYDYDKMYTNWDPRTLASQLNVSNAKKEGTNVTWDVTEGATAYAVFADGKLVAITTDTTCPADGYDEAVITVRAANGMGGFGPETTVSTSTGIATVANDNVTNISYYSVDGVKQEKAQRGINVRVRSLSNGQTIVDKVIMK